MFPRCVQRNPIPSTGHKSKQKEQMKAKRTDESGVNQKNSGKLNTYPVQGGFEKKMALYEKEVGGVSARGYNWKVWGPAGVFVFHSSWGAGRCGYA